MTDPVSVQSIQQQNTDSVCKLLKTFFNNKQSSNLYALTNEPFQHALPADEFKSFFQNKLFPLGKIKEITFENQTNGVGKYKAAFGSFDLTIILSLDLSGKLATLQFKPYVDDNSRKSYEVGSTNTLSSSLDKKVDSLVQPYISLKATSGLSIGILKNGKAIFYGYGETSKGNKKIPDEHTIFEIGSISKTFTAILLADAVNTNKVNLNDPINKYLPGSIPSLDYEGAPITLEHLINHSSGLPRLPINLYPSDSDNPFKDYANNDLLHFYQGFKPIRKPGEKYEYSNLAVGTLGMILEDVYHENYETLVTEKICNPLGMDDTRECLKDDSARFAVGYNQDGIYNCHCDFKTFAAAGSIRSTSADLLKYAKANFAGGSSRLAKAIQLTHCVTFADAHTKVALAWHYIKPGTDEILFHNGETGGYHSYLSINQKKQFAVVILSNCSLGTEEIGNPLLKWLEIN